MNTPRLLGFVALGFLSAGCRAFPVLKPTGCEAGRALRAGNFDERVWIEMAPFASEEIRHACRVTGPINSPREAILRSLSDPRVRRLLLDPRTPAFESFGDGWAPRAWSSHTSERPRNWGVEWRKPTPDPLDYVTVQLELDASGRVLTRPKVKSVRLRVSPTFGRLLLTSVALQVTGTAEPQPLVGWDSLTRRVVYPEMFRRAGIEGEGRVALVIDADGGLRRVVPSDLPSNDPEAARRAFLAETLAEAVRGLRFVPHPLDSARVTLTGHFRLIWPDQD